MKMQWTMALGGILVLLGLAGCHARPFARPLPEERVFAVAPDLALAEVKGLLESRQYRIHRFQPAAGKIEALSAIRVDSSLREAYQQRVRVSVIEEKPEGSRISVLATLLEEAEGFGQGNVTFERPLPKSFYQFFFEDLEFNLTKKDSLSE